MCITNLNCEIDLLFGCIDLFLLCLLLLSSTFIFMFSLGLAAAICADMTKPIAFVALGLAQPFAVIGDVTVLFAVMTQHACWFALALDMLLEVLTSFGIVVRICEICLLYIPVSFFVLHEFFFKNPNKLL